MQSIDRESDSYRSEIWLVPLEGGAPRRLTQSGPSNTEPRWSPDGGRLAFLSDRDGGSQQIFILPMDGGEARRVSDFASGVTAFEWSPDGRRMLAVCPVEVDPERRGARGDGELPAPDSRPEIVWRLPYKLDGQGYTLKEEIHLFVVETDGSGSRRLTDGPFEARVAHWSPDGDRVAYVRTREGRFAQRADVWVMSASGDAPRQLTHDVGIVAELTWSPDGRHIVFAGSASDGDARLRLWRVEVESGKVDVLGDDTVEVAEPRQMHWTEDDRALLYIEAWRGTRRVARIDASTGERAEVVGGERQLSELGCTQDHLVFVSQDAVTPGVVCATDREGRNERVVADFNAWWKERERPRVTLRQFEVPDGEGGHERIDGWLLRPADRDGPGPLLVDVHGGPAAFAEMPYEWHPHWLPLCARGWSILALNPVGSGSYGDAFAERLRGHWGELDLPQILAAVDALQADGLADERIAIAGKSYGGYLTAWAVGHTDRFRAAVCVAPVGNTESHLGTSDSGFYADPHAYARDGQAPEERARALSPVLYIGKGSTPTLFLQGKSDQRCPVGQSEELFVALMRGGKTPTELILYPGGSHHVFERGRPAWREDAARRMIDWLERWIEPEGR